MINWVETKDTLLGLALGLLLAGSLSNPNRMLAATAALVAAVLCIVIVRRRKAAADSA